MGRTAGRTPGEQARRGRRRLGPQEPLGSRRTGDPRSARRRPHRGGAGFSRAHAPTARRRASWGLARRAAERPSGVWTMTRLARYTGPCHLAADAPALAGPAAADISPAAHPPPGRRGCPASGCAPAVRPPAAGAEVSRRADPMSRTLTWVRSPVGGCGGCSVPPALRRPDPSLGRASIRS